MSQLIRAVGSFLQLFRNNLRSEYEANEGLKSAVESLVRRCNEYRSTSRLWGMSSAVLERSLNLMRLSDLCLKSLVPAGTRRAEGASPLQEKLDACFVLPQYYGGLKEANLLYYGGRAAAGGKKGRAVEIYRGSIAKQLMRLASRARSFLGLDGDIISHIENLLVPRIFRGLNCDESGMADMEQMLAEIRRRAGSDDADVVCADLRRTETSVEGSSYRCQFELEVEAFGAEYAVLNLVVSAVFSIQDSRPVLDRLSWEFLN
jgi:hypothetical protein